MKAISTIMLRSQPDERLAALAGEGSAAAFEALVLRYRRALVAYSRRLLLSESRSEDVVQQALLNAWSALRRGAEVREVQAWLYRITHNQALRTLARPEYDFDELSESLFGGDAPEADLERRQLMRETLAAVAALPEPQRTAIMRTAIEGYSYEQVAAALGLTDGAVRGLVHRARTTLRAAVAVIAPTPLVLRAATRGRRGGRLSPWLADATAGGGSAGASVALLKGATLVATSAVLAGGVGLPRSVFDGAHAARGSARPVRNVVLAATGGLPHVAPSSEASPGAGADSPEGRSSGATGAAGSLAAATGLGVQYATAGAARTSSPWATTTLITRIPGGSSTGSAQAGSGEGQREGPAPAGGGGPSPPGPQAPSSAAPAGQGAPSRDSGAPDAHAMGMPGGQSSAGTHSGESPRQAGDQTPQGASGPTGTAGQLAAS